MRVEIFAQAAYIGPGEVNSNSVVAVKEVKKNTEHVRDRREVRLSGMRLQQVKGEMILGTPIVVITIGWPWEIPLDVQRFFSQWYICSPIEQQGFSLFFFRGYLRWILG